MLLIPLLLFACAHMQLREFSALEELEADIGRNVKVAARSGARYSGELVSCDETGLVLGRRGVLILIPVAEVVDVLVLGSANDQSKRNHE